MTNSKLFSALMTTLFLIGMILPGQSQSKFSSKNTVQLAVAGTSTMHDWVMKSSTGDCNATMQVDSDGNLKGITAMNFSVAAKSLKSGKDGMDKNAYKALKTDKNLSLIHI